MHKLSLSNYVLLIVKKWFHQNQESRNLLLYWDILLDQQVAKRAVGLEILTYGQIETQQHAWRIVNFRDHKALACNSKSKQHESFFYDKDWRSTRKAQQSQQPCSTRPCSTAAPRAFERLQGNKKSIWWRTTTRKKQRIYRKVILQ